jgi:hypothetical protein
MSGNAAALNLTFDLGSGANFRAPAGAWANGNYTGATGSVSVVGTNGATFYVTGVKLEIGSVATPFNRQTMAKSMADCQRYYTILQSCQLYMYSTAGQLILANWTLPVFMRANPTVVISGIAGSSNLGALSNNVANNTNVNTYATITATGVGQVSFNLTMSAEL